MSAIDSATIQRVKLLVGFLTSPKAKKPAQANQQTNQSQTSYTSSSESELSLISASNELAEIIGGEQNHKLIMKYFSRNSVGLEEWRVLRAGLLACVHGRNIDPETRARFREAFMHVTAHDDVPVDRINNPFLSKVTTEEVFWAIDHLHNIFSNASHFHIATQRTGINSPSLLEQFIRHANGEAKAFSPAQTSHWTLLGRKEKGTIDDFPGPGFVISGLGKRTRLFPHRFIELSYPQISKPSSEITPKEAVENEYRKVLVKSESDLKKTHFALFRGITVVSNPEKMKIDGKSYALIIYNEHFHNDKQEIAFLVPASVTQGFIDFPVKFLNRRTFFHPAELMSRYGKEIIVPTYETALGGFDKTFPFGSGSPLFYKDVPRYDMWGHPHFWHLCLPEVKLGTKETNDSKKYVHRTHDFATLRNPLSGETHPGYWHNNFDSRNYVIDKLAHDEVRDCLFFAKSQYDLLKSAFRLYNFGYEFDPEKKMWTKDDFRLLRHAINLGNSNRYPSYEKPVLAGVEQGRNSTFNRDITRNVGIARSILTRGGQVQMIWQKSTSSSNKTGIDTVSLPHEIPQGELTDNKSSWEERSGIHETKNWLDLLNAHYSHHSDPTFFYGQESLINQLLTIMKQQGDK